MCRNESQNASISPQAATLLGIEVAGCTCLPGGRWSYIVLNPLTGGPLPGSGLKRGGGNTPTSIRPASNPNLR